MFDRILAAKERLAGHARLTPFLNSPLLDAAFGKRIFVKAECLQVTGSFKFRGAWSAATNLPKGAKGVLALSSGNHGQGVALAAARLGLPCVIVMPSDAPAIKIANTRAYGAEVVLFDRAKDDRDAIGERLCAERGLHLIRPFDDLDVIAGQGTCGLEIAEQASAAGIDRAEVLVCCGGGGLSAGIATALHNRAAGLTVRTCEPVGFDDMAKSLRSGQVVRNDRLSGSICDAILTPQPGQLTLPLLQNRAGDGLAVTDDEALKAVSLAFTHFRIVLEPGGAVALAGALFRNTSDPVICVASGGNVDPAIFTRALEMA